jgi:hypothetical protein
MTTNLTGKGETAAHTLAPWLKAVALFASTDATLPALCAVRMEASATDRTLTLVATNRYVLGSAVLPWDGDDLTLALPAASVKALLAVLTPAVKDYRRAVDTRVELAVSADAGPPRLRVSLFGRDVITVDVATDADSFPATWRNLIPGVDATGLPDGVVCLNPKYLALLSKLPDGAADRVSLRFTGDSRKPVVVTTTGDRADVPFTGVIMPIRKAGE